MNEVMASLCFGGEEITGLIMNNDLITAYWDTSVNINFYFLSVCYIPGKYNVIGHRNYHNISKIFSTEREIFFCVCVCGMGG